MALARSILNLCLVIGAPYLAAIASSAEVTNSATKPGAPKPEAPRWCEAVRDYYNSLLINHDAVSPFQVLPSLGLSGNGTSVQLAPGFKPHDTPYDPDDEPPQLSFSEETIDDKRVTLVSVTGSHDCTATAHVEVWSADLKHYLGNVEDALKHVTDRGDNTLLVLIKEKKYLLHRTYNSDEIDVLGFAPDLTPTLMCRVELEESQPEKIISSLDGRVCEAVLSGHAEEIPMETVKDRHLDRANFGAIPLEFGDQRAAEYQMFKRGRIDLANDGHPITVAMIRSFGDQLMGCGAFNLAWEWPVVLGGDGEPDLKSKLNLLTSAVGDQTSRLIRYRGKVYVDSHSLPYERESTHTVSEISATDVKVMCKFLPIQYVVTPLPPRN